MDAGYSRGYVTLPNIWTVDDICLASNGFVGTSCRCAMGRGRLSDHFTWSEILCEIIDLNIDEAA